MRPDLGRSNARDVSACSVAHASASISAFSVVLSLVRVVCAQEVRLPDEETLVIVVRVDEPAREPVGTFAPDLARARMKDINAPDVHLDQSRFWGFPFRRQELDVGFPEDDEQGSPCLVFASSSLMSRFGVHARLQHGQRPELVELGCVHLEVERAGDQHVELTAPRARGPAVPPCRTPVRRGFLLAALGPASPSL